MFRSLFSVILVALFQGRAAGQYRVEYEIVFDDPVDGNQIIGGQKVIGREFPHLVSIQDRYGRHFCGGSILNAEWIVTAAHCFDFESMSEIVKVGSNDNRFGTVHRIRKAVLHPDYRGHLTWHDLALVQVSPKISFTTSVRPVKLPRENQVTPVGSRATVAGWGNLRRDGGLSRDLYKLDLKVTDWQKCRRVYQPYSRSPLVHRNHICAGTGYDMKAACNGDSGGPLISNGEVIGVVSFGSTICAVASHPTVFTEIAKYIPWIRSIIGKQ